MVWRRSDIVVTTQAKLLLAHAQHICIMTVNVTVADSYWLYNVLKASMSCNRSPSEDEPSTFLDRDKPFSRRFVR